MSKPIMWSHSGVQPWISRERNGEKMVHVRCSNVIWLMKGISEENAYVYIECAVVLCWECGSQHVRTCALQSFGGGFSGLYWTDIVKLCIFPYFFFVFLVDISGFWFWDPATGKTSLWSEAKKSPVRILKVSPRSCLRSFGGDVFDFQIRPAGRKQTAVGRCCVMCTLLKLKRSRLSRKFVDSKFCGCVGFVGECPSHSFRSFWTHLCATLCWNLKLKSRCSWKFTRAKASQKHEIKSQWLNIDSLSQVWHSQLLNRSTRVMDLHSKNGTAGIWFGKPRYFTSKWPLHSDLERSQKPSSILFFWTRLMHPRWYFVMQFGFVPRFVTFAPARSIYGLHKVRSFTLVPKKKMFHFLFKC